MSEIRRMIMLGLMKKLIEDGGGIAHGTPDHLDHEGRICDQFGRRLLTVKEHKAHMDERDKWCRKLYRSIATKHILDPVTGDAILAAGSIFTATVIAELLEAGFDPEPLVKFYTTPGLKSVITEEKPNG